MRHTPAKRAKTPLDLSEKCLVDLAIGADPTHVIAARYGMDELDIEVLLQNPAVTKRIEAIQAELTTKGEFFKLKSRMLAEDLLEKVYRDARDTDDAKTRLDAVKFLSMAGGVDKPAEQKQVGTGRQVVVNIDLGAAGGAVGVRLSFDEVFGDGSAGSAAERNADLIADGEFEELDDE